VTDTRRQALLLALAAARGYLRGLTCPPPLAPPVPPLVGARAVAVHEALGLLLAAGAVRDGWAWWALVRVVWAAGRLYERAYDEPGQT
jgi:hypothetical protein